MKLIASLKRALTLHFVLAAAVPLVIFALITQNYVSEHLVREVARDNVFLAGEIRAQTEAFLRRPVSVMQHIRSVLDSGVLATGPDIDDYLEKEVKSSNFLESIFILDASGKVVNLGVSSSLEHQKDDYLAIDLSLHDLFENVEDEDDMYWSDTFISLVTGEPSITIGLPVGRQTLVGNLSLIRLNEIVARFTYVENISFAIIDRKGGLIAHSDPLKAIQRFSMLFHPEVLQVMETGEPIELNIHEDTSLLETVQKIPETDWIVWVGRERKDVLRPVDKVRNFMLIVFSLSIVFGILLSLFNSRKLMRPISGLVDDASRLADGDFNLNPPPGSYREIDELALAFDRMARAVIEREGSVREREERFRNLVNSIEGIVWEYDLEQDAYVFVSRHSEQMLGVPNRKWLESPDFWKSLVHPDDRQWVNDYFRGLSEGKLSPQFEYRMIDASGQVIWVRNMVNVVDEADRPKRLYGVIIDITDRKGSEIALRESELRFRSLVEHAADAILIHDQDGRFVEVNDQACKSLGYSRDELLRLSVQEVEIGHDPVHFSSLWTTVKHGRSLTLEGEHRRKDGSTFPVEIRIGALRFQDSPLFLALVRDISERKKSDAALRDSEERYRSVVTAMSEGVLLLDRSGKLIASNPAAESILRKSHEELIRIMADNGWRAVRESGEPYRPEEMPFNLSLATGQSFQGVIMGLDTGTSAGERVWMEVNTQPVMHSGDEKPSGVVVTFIDVTEKRRVVQALQESEEQVRLLLNSTAEGIYGLDLDGNCTFCNPAALELLGYAHEDELLGRNMHAVIHHSETDGTPIDSEACQIFKAFTSTRFTHSDKEVFWRSDGTWFHTEYWAHPIIKGDMPIGAVVTFHDISERIQLQQQSIRTAQLASLGELAAGVAHEINNPINGVINYAQILLNRLEKHNLETDLAGRIIKEGERIATIVRDLLFFAREGGPELRISDIGEVIGEALSLTEAQIRKEGILLKLDIEQDLPKIRTRAQQIQQLFLNILSNARHALNEKYPQADERKIIEITVRPFLRADHLWLRMSIRDYGTGIPEEMLNKVMNPFVTTKPAGIGTGLGLSISHEIVRNHNGFLGIDSEEGEWTEVVIELPSFIKETE